MMRRFPRSEGFATFHSLRRSHDGGQARIYRGERNGRSYALKFAAGTSELSSVERLRWEARIGILMRHRNLAPVEELGMCEGIPYAACQWLDGVSLFDLVTRAGPAAPALGWDELAFVVSELLSALDYVHRRELVHLDVSLENVIISSDGTPKLLDFGIAAPAGPCGDAPYGKAPYLAPERLTGTQDGRSDQYSLGVMTAELAGIDLSAALALPATNSAAALTAMVVRMTQHDPAARFEACAEARRRLGAAVGWRALRRGRRAVRSRVLAACAPPVRHRALMRQLARQRRLAALAVASWVAIAAVAGAHL